MKAEYTCCGCWNVYHLDEVFSVAAFWGTWEPHRDVMFPVLPVQNPAHSYMQSFDCGRRGTWIQDWGGWGLCSLFDCTAILQTELGMRCWSGSQRAGDMILVNVKHVSLSVLEFRTQHLYLSLSDWNTEVPWVTAGCSSTKVTWQSHSINGLKTKMLSPRKIVLFSSKKP